MRDARIVNCTHEVERLAEEALGRGRRDEEALAGLMAAIEARVQAVLLSERPDCEARPACAHGCATCCTVNVGTLAIEGAAAAAWLRQRSGPGETGQRAAELLRFHGGVRWLDDGERIRARVRCPFVDSAGGCAIHPVRPLACRGLSSLDAGECRQALEERGEEDGPGLIRMNLLQKALYDGALDALEGVLARRGLDARRRDVSGMAGYFLADSGHADAWAAGVPVGIE